MRFIQANTLHCHTLADIHNLSFQGFFLTSLGKNFLKTYYSASIKSPESIVILALDDITNCPIGFASGCILSKGYHKRLLKANSLSFLISLITVIFIRPLSIFRLLKNLEKRTSLDGDSQYAELLSIAIYPSHAGKGIGKLLLQDFERRVKARGVSKLALTTDFDKNENTLMFYKNCGYSVLDTFVTYPKRKMYKLIKEL